MEKPSGVPKNTRLLFFSGLKSSTFCVWIPSGNQEKAAMPCNGGSKEVLSSLSCIIHKVHCITSYGHSES